MHSYLPIINRIVNGLTNSLNIASKAIPLFEKGKPLLEYLKKGYHYINNKQKNIPLPKNVLNKKASPHNNPTFFK